MAESNLTKKALALAFKQLVSSQSLEKVGVSDICETCRVSRKTFSYHFQDKYALVEWIFETEFISAIKGAPIDERWVMIDTLCRYLYRERNFYGKLMQFGGQNSFREYFQTFLFRFVEHYIMPKPDEIRAVAGQGGVTPEAAQLFYSHFVADAVLVAVFRWLSEGAELPPEDFVALLRSTDILIHLQRGASADAADGGAGKLQHPVGHPAGSHLRVQPPLHRLLGRGVRQQAESLP